jgi:hypothetical protein
MGPERWLVNLVSIVVIGAWVASVAAGLITSDYTALGVTTPVMLILAGYAFGIKITKNGGKT